jgi:hypothetical protein
MSSSNESSPTTELRIARQIVRLFRRSEGIVWELVPAPGPRQANDVTIRDADGTLLAYARAMARGGRAWS